MKPVASYDTVAVRDLIGFTEAFEERHRLWQVESDAWFDPWFRGVSNAEYGLVPGLYRPKWLESQKDYDLEDDDFRVDFQLKAIPYLKEMRASSDWDEYFLMQHYGLPTRLLDWSESALIALYFAVGAEPRPCTPADAAVWMLDPWWFNKQAGYDDDMYFTTDEEATPYLPPPYSGETLPKRPIAILAPHNSPRLTAQRGLFTIHGKKREPLEAICEDRPHKNRMVKFLIPQDATPRVRRQLRIAGVSATTIYPDLAGLCSELRQDWSDLPDFNKVENAEESSGTQLSKRPPNKRRRPPGSSKDAS